MIAFSFEAPVWAEDSCIKNLFLQLKDTFVTNNSDEMMMVSSNKRRNGCDNKILAFTNRIDAWIYHLDKCFERKGDYVKK